MLSYSNLITREHPAQFNRGRLEQKFQGLRIELAEASNVNLLGYYMSCSVTRISLNGALMRAEKPLPIDSQYTMELTIPGDLQPLRVTGRIAYCKEMLDKISACYETGVEFIRLTENDRIILREVIRTLRK